ncbi:hypothetical protein [Streptomyces sp. enrichment culture]|uniref:hypothetical protein n=1 Tax=Streptomyces sp. enrichment culture TaxID=1795815 RepID=UPI003F57E76D
MRRLAYAFGAAAAAGAAVYFVVYLYRWQWQRAVLCGVVLLVVEVLMLGLVMLGRLSRIEERVRDTDRRQREFTERQRDVLARLRQGQRAEESGPRFRWLDEPAERTFVFVPVLMVTGVLLSGIAWLVQRVAASTSRPAERHLAGRLAVLAAPDPAVGADLDDIPPPGGRRSPRRTARLVVAGAVGTALLGGLVVGLAELTQTRHEPEDASAATSVLVRIDVRGDDMTPERRALAARQLWEGCRDSTSVPLSKATLGDLGDGVFAGVVRPALTEHDRLRLRGCLEDTGLERAHLTVVGMGDAEAYGR